MRLLTTSAYGCALPRMYRVRQEFRRSRMGSAAEKVRNEILKESIAQRVRPGMNIAILVGSRGICNLADIVRSAGETLRDLGAKPFVIPAMGSHGGADAEGQRQVLASYGITPDGVGMEVVSSMEVELLGHTAQGVAVYADSHAVHADMIVPVGRVKPHTDFRGRIESGLCKMLAIGMGKHRGCSELHRYGFENFHWIIPEVGEYAIQNARVGFGIAIVEDGYDRTYSIEALPAEEIMSREPELLRTAKELMPGLRFERIDALIVDRIGKDISGAGMDPNIIGRTARGRIVDFDGPDILRILVCGLTELSHGNACGIGMADFMLRSCLEEIDWHATAINAISSGNPGAARLPVPVEDIREGILACVQTAPGCDPDNIKIVRIADTLSLGEIEVSEALLPQVPPDMVIGPGAGFEVR